MWGSSRNSRLAQICDFVITYICLVLAYINANVLHSLSPTFFPAVIKIRNKHLLYATFISFLYVFLFDKHKAYSYQRFTSLKKEYEYVIKVNLIGVILAIVTAFIIGLKEIPRTIFFVFFVISLLVFLIEKTCLFYIADVIRKQGKNRKRVVLIGTGTRAQKFIDIVNRNFSWGLDIVGALTGDEQSIGTYVNNVKVVDHYSQIKNVLREINPEEIIITISTKRFDQIRNILEACEEEGVLVRLNSDFFGHITKDVTVDRIYGLNIISFSMVNQPEAAMLLKRLIDIIGSIVALILFSPFMLAAAIGILITDGRPIFYEWNVIGRNKKPFKSWKFRTMVKNADQLKKDLSDKNEMNGPVFKINHDPRILPFGRWLRKWSIDETPQLFSILKGDMSLVGPRPVFPYELVKYESWQRRKLSIKPGITCFWQASGRNQIKNFDEWVKLDLEYIDNWSLLLDLKILLKTIPAVLLGRGAS